MNCGKKIYPIRGMFVNYLEKNDFIFAVKEVIYCSSKQISKVVLPFSFRCVM